MNNQFIELLRCPASGKTLTYKNDRLIADNESYPLIGNIPWLFKNPDYAFAEWSTKAQNYIDDEQLKLKHLQHQINDAKNPLLKKRLQKNHEARLKNLSVMKKVLKDFLTQKKIPVMSSKQQVQSYFNLFFRDWCWGDEELTTYVNFVASALQDNAKNVLILGSGSGGLSYHLAQKLPEPMFFSAEHNPFLALASDHIMQGKSLKLHELCHYPKSLDQISKKWEIKVPKLTNNNHQILLTSFPELPFEKASFDVIIAPWFLDILDLPFPIALNHAISFLKDSGQLIFFGPANIHKQNTKEQLCPEEISQYIEQYFEHCDSNTDSLYYADSPNASQRREETLLFVSASSVKRREESIAETQEFNDIAYTAELESYKMMVTTHHNILEHINGNMSYQDLAAILVNQFGFGEEESKIYAVAFMKQIYQNAYP